MGLFSRKKKELPERNLPEFPRFPEMPSYNESKPVSPIPTYESEFKKEEIQERRQEPIPSQSQKNMWERPQPWTREQNIPQESERQEPIERRFDIPVRQQPSYANEQQVRPEFRMEEKPYRVASPPPITRFEPDVWKPAPENKQGFEERQPQEMREQTQVPGEKPVFVKIQQYREAITSIAVSYTHLTLPTTPYV